MKFHQTQSEVVKSRTRFRVVDCGRQWGKTTLAVWEMFACAYAKKDRRVAYFATTFEQARNIAWELLKSISKTVWASTPNESRLELTIKTQDGGTSKIFLDGFVSIETRRGEQFDFVVLDEVAKMRNFREGWEGVLQGTLAFRNGTALFISTPAGFNHFHDLYERGQSGDPNWKSWRFTSYDNPYLSKDYLAMIQGQVTPDFWAQEYLADFRRFTGLVYQEFDMERHVHFFEHSLNQHGDYYFGQDFAVRGWTAMVDGWVRPDGHVYILDVYKKESLPAKTHAESEKEMLKSYADLDKYVGYADPAGFAKNQQSGQMIWSIADEYIESGLPIIPANNEVTPGINYIRQLFQKDMIHIHPRCEALVEELLQYQWKEQTKGRIGQEDDPEKVRKINDHLLDAMRYMIYSKPQPAEKEEEKRTTVFPAQFPLKLEETPKDEFTPMEFGSLYDG